MIASINGDVILVGSDHLVINVGGVGIQVSVPSAVCAGARVGEAVFLHTHLVVREDALILFGFEQEMEKAFFNLLLSVNGVGPRTALAILSSLSVDAIRRAVLSEQPEVFTRVPGIGKKSAQRILLNLQGRVGEPSPLERYPLRDVDSEVIEALTALGYSIVEAQTALQSLPQDAPEDVEERLRMALQHFSS